MARSAAASSVASKRGSVAGGSTLAVRPTRLASEFRDAVGHSASSSAPSAQRIVARRRPMKPSQTAL